MAEIKSIRDLHVLRLDDLDTYNRYIKHSSCPANCWWGQFPYFWGYSLTKKRQSYWAIVDDLFVPFLFSGKYLSLLTMPFGQGSPETYIIVLKQCLNMCARQNGTNQQLTHLRWVTDDQIEFLQQAPDFDKFFDAEKLSIGPEYHYGVRALVNLEGKEFASVRYKRNLFRKKHQDITIREYLSSDYPNTIELNDKWLTAARKRYGNIFDKAYYPAFLENHQQLDHIILVAVRGNEIIGMIAGNVAPDGQAYCFLRKVLREYNGLSELLLLGLVQAIHEKDESAQLLNDGGTGLKSGMVNFKNRFRPEKLVDRYCLRMNSLQIIRQTSYKGPNLTGYSPSVRLVLEESRTDLFTVLPDETLQHLNTLISTALGSDAMGIDWKLEKKPALIIAQVAVLIQQASRHPVKQYGASRITPDKAEIYFELLRPSLLAPLVECLQAFWRSGFLGFDSNIFVDQYQADRQALGFTLNEYIVWDRIRTAQRLGVDARPEMGLRVWLGRGSDSRLISLGYTQNTPRLAKKIAGDKSLSFDFMMKRGLPLPKQKIARSEKAAVLAAQSIGYPVVVKPRHGNKGQGVSVNLVTDEAVIHAFKEARKTDQSVVVESFVEGEDYRLLVMNNRFIAAVKRIPAHIVGDGQHSVKELMEITNRNERRDGLFLYPLKENRETGQLLRQQKLDLNSVPVKGKTVWLRGAANVSLGGTIEDVTELVHPDNRAAAVSAAETCLLDVAGIDFKSIDITQSWHSGYGKIIEINAGPGVELHMEPTIGPPREVTHHLIRSHFQPRRHARQPLIIVAGRYGKENIARHCAELWSRLGICPGLLLKDHLETGTDTIQTGKSLHEQMSILDRRPEIDAAVAPVYMSSLLEEGLGVNRTTCAVLTDDLIPETIIQRYHDPQLPSRVFKLLADTATNGVVIDGRNSKLYEAVKHLPSDSIVMVWPEPYISTPPPLKKHCVGGGRALGLITSVDRDQSLIWYENNSSHTVPIPQIKPDRLKPVMMAIAALLVSTTPLKKIQPILHQYKETASKPSRNSLLSDLCSQRGIRVACADPGDIAARNIFCKRYPATRGTLYLVASGKPGMIGEWKHWTQNLPAKQVCYMLEAEQGNTPPFAASRIFYTLEEALQQALQFARKNDTILLLAQGHTLRRQFFNHLREQPFTPQCGDNSPLWPADTLAELFNGTWINGRECGWGAERVGWGKTMVGSDMVTILPGNFPEKSKDIAPMEAAVEETAWAGAYGVISAVLSNNLPRWKAAMQADDPYAGLLRLAAFARRRLQGLVISVSTGSDNMQSLLDQLADYLSSKSNMKVCVQNAAVDESLDQVTGMALSIANTRPECPLTIYPWEQPDPFIGLILRPDIVVVDGAGPILNTQQKLLTCLEEETLIFALIPPEQEDHWRMVDNKSGRQVHLFISSSTDKSHKPDWERMLDAMLEHAIHLVRAKKSKQQGNIN